jgi:hypothetical protein
VGECGVVVGTEALDAGGHGNSDADAGVEEAGCQRGFAEAEVVCYADFCTVDFGGGED